MTKDKTSTEFSDEQLEEIRGGRLFGLGTTRIVQKVTTNAIAATALSATGGSATGSTGSTVAEPTPGKTSYIGAPPSFDKARHDALLSTIRNTM